MRLLLDTHVALWAITHDARLSADAPILIESPANQIFVSAVSGGQMGWPNGVSGQMGSE
jgi:PIN domain nuclease of toxin-antitoxin system